MMELFRVYLKSLLGFCALEMEIGKGLTDFYFEN